MGSLAVTLDSIIPTRTEPPFDYVTAHGTLTNNSTGTVTILASSTPSVDAWDATGGWAWSFQSSVHDGFRQGQTVTLEPGSQPDSRSRTSGSRARPTCAPPSGHPRTGLVNSWPSGSPVSSPGPAGQSEVGTSVFPSGQFAVDSAAKAGPAPWTWLASRRTGGPTAPRRPEPPSQSAPGPQLAANGHSSMRTFGTHRRRSDPLPAL